MSTAFPKSIKSFFGLAFSFIALLLSCIQGAPSLPTTEMPVTPADFVPAVRFVVCSDIHDNNENLADMIDTTYALFDNDPTYAGLDLVAVCGDMTKIGLDGELDAFKATLDAHIKEGTRILPILGNHELKNLDSRDYFTKIFGLDPEQHIVVNGFHFIGVSNSALGYFPVSTQKWAEDAVAAAQKDAPGLPIFSFQHPHNSCTVYGSVTWASPLLNKVWEGNCNVVNFSGHSHFPMNDPRSIWQGGYTALGCGGMEYFELDKDLVIGQNPEGYEDCAQFYIVEADRDGSVRIRCYDLVSDGFFGEEHYIDNVNDRTGFAYTYKNRMAYDDAPVFAEDAQISLQANEAGEYILTFDKAQDKFIVHDYKVKITDSLGIIKYSKTLLSDYYLVDTDSVAKYNLGKLWVKNGESCKVEIVAVNAYFELSEPLTATVIAE